MKKLITLLSILLFGIFSISSCSNSGSNDSNENNNEKSEEITDIEKMIGFDPNTPLGSYLTRNPLDFCKGFSKKYDDEYNQVDESKTKIGYNYPDNKSCDYVVRKYNSNGEELYEYQCQTYATVRHAEYRRYSVLNGQPKLSEEISMSSAIDGVYDKFVGCGITYFESDESAEFYYKIDVDYPYKGPLQECNVLKSRIQFYNNDDYSYSHSYYYINDNKVSQEEYKNTCPEP